MPVRGVGRPAVITPRDDVVSQAGVDYVCSPDDGRVLALHVVSAAMDVSGLPPTLQAEPPTPAGVAGQTASARMAQTKGHLTPVGWPLQVLLLRRGPGPSVRPHVHRPPVAGEPVNAFAQQVLICQSGRARVGVFTHDGIEVAQVTLEPHALVFLTEGHAVEFLEPDTVIIEVKQGPVAGVDVDDKIDVGSV